MKKRILLLSFIALSSIPAFAQNVPSYVPSNGLVGWWPFNGNANDESGNGNNGTVNGATLTTDRFGLSNKAYSFDGVDDYNEIDVNSLLANGLTISVWITSSLADSLFDHKGIIWTRLSGPQGNPPFQPNQATGIMIYPNGLLCVAGDGYAPLVQIQDSGNYYNDSSWYHLVFSYDILSGDVRTVINGIETATTNSTGLSNIDLAYNTLKIGKDEIIGYGNRHWEGKIDDIGIWNRALSQQEILNLYNGTSAHTDENSFPLASVHPNPTTGEITITSNETNNKSYSLYNSLGQLVASGMLNAENTTLSIQEFAPGIYTLQLQGEKNTTLKIVKE